MCIAQVFLSIFINLVIHLRNPKLCALHRSIMQQSAIMAQFLIFRPSRAGGWAGGRLGCMFPLHILLVMASLLKINTRMLRQSSQCRDTPVLEHRIRWVAYCVRYNVDVALFVLCRKNNYNTVLYIQLYILQLKCFHFNNFCFKFVL